MASHSVASSYVAMIIDFAAMIGFSRQTLLDFLGLTEKQLLDADFRVSARAYDDLFGMIADGSGFTHFGLRCGQLVRPGHYGVVGYVVMNCHTFGEALRQAERYQCIVGDVGRTVAHRISEEVQIRWIPNIDPVHPQMVEQHVTAIVAYAWWLTGVRRPPSSIHFRHAGPASVAEHEAFFGCPVHFSQAYDGLVFPVEYADIPIPTPDASMREMMARHAETLLSKLSTRSDFIDRVKAVMATRMAEGVPTLELVCEAFDLHPRAFQRKLQEEHQSFKQLLDETRRELAIHYMGDRSVALPEIAFMLGFSEQAVFQRAFKRWTGRTPGHFRRESLAVAES